MIFGKWCPMFFFLVIQMDHIVHPTYVTAFLLKCSFTHLINTVLSWFYTYLKIEFRNSLQYLLTFIFKRLLFYQAALLVNLCGESEESWIRMWFLVCGYIPQMLKSFVISAGPNLHVWEAVMMGFISGFRVLCPGSAEMPKAASVLCII